MIGRADSRIGELIHLLPDAPFGSGLFVGIDGFDSAEDFADRVQKANFVPIQKMETCPSESFDLVFCVIPKATSSRVFEEAMRVTSGIGITVFVMRRRALGLRHIPKTIRVEMVYGLSPSLGDLRLAVPMKNRGCAAASLALYQPSLILAKMGKFLAYLLSTWGLTSFWCPWIFMTVRKKQTRGLKGIHAVLLELFGRDTELALFPGTPGYLRKATLQIMDRSGCIRGYCKLATKPQTRAMLENEARILRLLKSHDLGNALVPELLYYGMTSTGQAALIQSTLKQHRSKAPLNPNKIHADFLRNLFLQTKIAIGFRESSCYAETAARIATLEARSVQIGFNELHRAFEWSAQILGECRVPLCFAHRDFTPWNTFLAGRNLYVFDWEFGRERWVPMTDAFHFVLQKGILVDHLDEESIRNIV